MLGENAGERQSGEANNWRRGRSRLQSGGKGTACMTGRDLRRPRGGWENIVNWGKKVSMARSINEA